jgi:hypothetical protein
MLWWLLATAQAATVEDVEARLAAIEELRALRVAKDAPKISDDDVRRAAAGTIVVSTRSVEGYNYPKAYGAALIDMSIGRFWAGLNDETRHPGYTSISYSELLSGSICKSGRHILQFLDTPFPVTDRWWIGILTANATLMRESGGSVRELSWKSSVDPAEVTSASGKLMIAQGEPIASTKGAWFLVAIDDDSTWLEYYSWSDPGSSIPASIASSLVSKGVRNNIAAITKFATEGKPTCPIE